MLHRVLTSCIAILSVAVIAPLSAHHSSAPHFDRDTTIELDAYVTDLQFINLHAYVYFDVEGKDGQAVPWRCELSAVTALQRRGWTEDTPLQAGM